MWTRVGGTQSWYGIRSVRNGNPSEISCSRSQVSQASGEDRFLDAKHLLHLVNELYQEHMRVFAPHSGPVENLVDLREELEFVDHPFLVGLADTANCEMWSHSTVCSS